MHTIRRALALLTGLVTALVTLAAPALAAPPDGCYGLPDVPAAFLCVSGFAPANALPATDGGTTVIVPRFCAGECFGPTPVTIPGFATTPGAPPVMTLHYQGEQYPVGAGLPCTGGGTLATSPALYWSFAGSFTYADLWVTLPPTCGSLRATGTVGGWCDSATGRLTLTNGARSYTSNFVVSPGLVTFTGPEIAGSAVLLTESGQSCSAGPGAYRFQFAAPALVFTGG